MISGKWIRKIWYIYTMEHYSAIRNDETLPFATTWVDFEIILSEFSQSQKAEDHLISLTCGI